MTLRRVGLVAGHSLPRALEALSEAAAWLAAKGLTPVLEAESAAALPVKTTYAVASREDLPRAVDAVIAFGGDGTLLDAAGAVVQSEADVPVLGVNLGRLGFLTEVNRADLTAALEALVAGRTWTELRVMLAGRIERDTEVLAERLALNDIVVSRSTPSRMIEIEVAIDGRVACLVKADGVILATATGSTAYNLSAGGPIVHPAVDAIVLTPIAPHTLTQRPLVLPATAHITLKPLADRYSAEMLVTFDGQFHQPLGGTDLVTVRRASRALRLVRTTDRTHYDMLREKLKWGQIND